MDNDPPAIPLSVIEGTIDNHGFPGAVAVSIAAVLGALAVWFSMPYLFVFVVILVLIALKSEPTVESLVIRNTDFFTTTPEARQPIGWRDIAAMEVIDTHVEIVFYDQSRKKLFLSFLDDSRRYDAVLMMMRIWEVFRHHGTFRFPPFAQLPTVEGIAFRSERLQFLPYQELHHDLCIRVNTDPSNIDVQLGLEMSPEWESKRFGAEILAMETHSLFWRFGIQLEGLPIGFISLQVKDIVLRQACLGIDLVPEHQRKGIGTEAITAIIEYARVQTNLIKIEAGCFSENVPCWRALERAGFRHCGTFEQFWIKNGNWRSGERFEMIL